MGEKLPCVYLMADRKDGTLYAGVTSDLIARVHQHKSDEIAGFTRRYQIHRLVWFERHDTMESAILREKALKKWRRAWKIELIESQNPDWKDLYASLF